MFSPKSAILQIEKRDDRAGLAVFQCVHSFTETAVCCDVFHLFHHACYPLRAAFHNVNEFVAQQLSLFIPYPALIGHGTGGRKLLPRYVGLGFRETSWDFWLSLFALIQLQTC